MCDFNIENSKNYSKTWMYKFGVEIGQSFQKLSPIFVLDVCTDMFKIKVDIPPFERGGENIAFQKIKLSKIVLGSLSLHYHKVNITMHMWID